MVDSFKGARIAYVTMRDPRDRRTWSGTYYYMAQALQKLCKDVTFLGPLHAAREERVAHLINRGALLFFRKSYMTSHCFLVARKYAREVAQKLAAAERPYDLIVAPAGATVIPFLETDIPIVLIEDATYAQLQNYYPAYSNLLKRSMHEMDVLERLALKKARVIVSSSAWAARSVIDDYHVEASRVHVIPFGANFDDIPPAEVVMARTRTDRCRLLFVGVNWQTKGGDIALEALCELERLGLEAELTVCGCIPPAGVTHPRMTVIPFLDKNDEQQRQRLARLYMTSDFLVLPTRNDCTPVVCSEAAAFALPVLATRTGGVPDVVREAENGFTLSYEARGAAYAQLIAEVYRDHERYAALVRSCRAAYDQRLSWDAWRRAFETVLTAELSLSLATC
jgi:glycosyltransferase involved in cell wall biosynthesis